MVARSPVQRARMKCCAYVVWARKSNPPNSRRVGRMILLAEIEFFNQLPVGFKVCFLEVLQKPLALAYQFQQ